MKETKMSILSDDNISFFNSEYILGSLCAPVNKELCDMDVIGLSALMALFPKF